MRARLCLALLVVASLATQAREFVPAGELLNSGDEEFRAKAEEASYDCLLDDQCLYAAHELIAIADRLAGTVRSIRDPRKDGIGSGNYAFGHFFDAACAKADDNQLAALVEIYGRLDANSVDKSQALPRLAARCLARDVKTLAPERLHVVLDKAQPDLPAELKHASNGLQRAWRLYRRAAAPFARAFPSQAGNKEEIDAYANQKAFYTLIEAALRGAESVGEELAKYADLSAGCLNITSIDDGKDIGTLLALLHAGKLDQAVGAALRVASSSGSISSPEVFAEPVIQFLRAVELDWEAVFVGAVTDAAVKEWAPDKLPLLDALAAFGTDRSAFLIIELAQLVKHERRAAYATAFEKWVQPDESPRRCGGAEVPIAYTSRSRERKAPVTPAMHKAVLRATHKLVTRDCSEQLGQAALNVFSRSLSSDSGPALRLLANHRSPDVAEKATQLLCALGVETPEHVRGAPVRFRIIVAGEPLRAGQRIHWWLKSPGSARGSTAEVAEDGTFQLERKLFARANSGPATLDLRGSASSEDPQHPEFSVSSTPPADLEAVTELQVDASELTIRLNNLEVLNGPPPETARVTLTRKRDDETYGLFDFSDPIEVSARAQISFSRLQNGRYNVSVSVAGAETWRGEAKVGPGEPPLDVALQPGSDLTFKLIAPDGQRWYGARLLKGDKEIDSSFDDRTSSYRSLGCGDYVLRVIGSDEISRPRERKIVRGPDEVAFAGRDIPVKIQPGSPTVIDLGEIRLQPAEP